METYFFRFLLEYIIRKYIPIGASHFPPLIVLVANYKVTPKGICNAGRRNLSIFDLQPKLPEDKINLPPHWIFFLLICYYTITKENIST
jgi:hypothetical protein